MQRVSLLTLGLVGLSICAHETPAFAGDWVQFTNETATRLVADTAVGANDGEERDYAWGDLNNNGWIDLVAMRKEPFNSIGKRRNVLFMNEEGVLVDRSAEFASASDVPGDQGFLTPTNDRQCAIVDVVNNGWLDIVTAVTLSDGDPKHISHPRVYMNQGNVSSGDWQGFIFENDRIPVLACCNGAVPHAPRFNAVAAGDVNASGFADLYFGDGAVCCSLPPTTFDFKDRLLINDGNGFFSDSRSAIPEAWLSSAFTAAVVITDLNGNGVADIVRNNANGAFNVRAFYNDPTNIGTFIHNQLIIGASPTYVAAGDINNNQRPDLAVARNGTNRVMYNMGTDDDGVVTWEMGPILPNSIGFQFNIVLTDLDQSGWLDMFIANMDLEVGNCFSGQPARMYRNNADPPLNSFSVDYGNIDPDDFQRLYDVAVFDINGDGWLDIVSAHGCSVPATKVWIQSPPPVDTCPADLNGDNIVNVADLLIMLGNWGPCMPPDPCIGDCNGDGEVNVQDLLCLLGQWGPCP